MQKTKRFNNLKWKVIFMAGSVLLLGMLSSYFYFDDFHSLLLQGPITFPVIVLILIAIFSLIVFISRKVFFTRIKPERKLYGSRLQKRVLLLFNLLSSIPTFVLAILATVFFYYVVDAWFDKRITGVLSESISVAESHLKEHQEVIKAKVRTMADEIDDNVLKHDLVSNSRLFGEILNSFVELNDVSEAVIFYGYNPIIKSKFGRALSFERIAVEYYRRAAKGEIVMMKNPNKIRAMVRLHSVPGSFLVIGKYVDDKLIGHIRKSKEAVAKYKSIRNDIIQLQLKFVVVFLVVSLGVLIIAGFMGRSLSGAIVNPIIRLVDATNKVKDGIFSVKLPEGPINDEIANLSKAFNVMTKRISEQQRSLIQAYNEIDQKRKFGDMILSGVSTGIIVLSSDYKVKLINKAGMTLLGLDNDEVKNLDLWKVLPECVDLIDKVGRIKTREVDGEVKVRRKGRILTLLMKVVTESNKGNNISSYIIAFDDMTQLIQAQRSEAWADIARRIAHEVKNPLTPIQLAAERIKQKYSKEVKDKKLFNMYTDTIIKHSQDIGKIIEEFSRFAKMPSAVLEKTDFSKLVRDIVFSREIINSDIKYELDIEKDIVGFFDSMQIRQMLGNILKNAEESINSLSSKNRKKKFVKVFLKKEKETVCISVEDSGKGFEVEAINKIIEPYFTTKTKGTGVGLSIVKKIVDEHEGKLIIKNNVYDNAVVEVLLPLNLNI